MWTNLQINDRNIDRNWLRFASFIWWIQAFERTCSIISCFFTSFCRTRSWLWICHKRNAITHKIFDVLLVDVLNTFSSNSKNTSLHKVGISVYNWTPQFWRWRNKTCGRYDTGWWFHWSRNMRNCDYKTHFCINCSSQSG